MRSNGRAPRMLVTIGVEVNVGTHVSDSMVSVAHKLSLAEGCSVELGTDCLSRGKVCLGSIYILSRAAICVACHMFLFRL